MRFASLGRLALGAAVAVLLQGAAFQEPVTPEFVPKTQVASAAALQKLVANKGVTLQWNWEARPGTLTVSVRDGFLALKGEQHATNGGSLDIDGVVTKLDERNFMFRGRIALHDAEANVDCVRDGDYTFRITGARKFWRLKEQIAGCAGREDLTDYVDILF